MIMLFFFCVLFLVNYSVFSKCFLSAEMEFEGPEFRGCIESVYGGAKLGTAIKRHKIPFKSRTAIYQRFGRHVNKKLEERRLQESKCFK